jgi:hypothetical protein
MPLYDRLRCLEFERADVSLKALTAEQKFIDEMWLKNSLDKRKCQQTKKNMKIK